MRGFLKRIGFRLNRREGGQAITEFVLIVPFLLIICCGIFDLGFYCTKLYNVSNAAIDITRTIQSNPDLLESEEDRTEFLEASFPKLDLDKAVVSVDASEPIKQETYTHHIYVLDEEYNVVDYPRSSNVYHKDFSVSITYNDSFVTPFGAVFGLLAGDELSSDYTITQTAYGTADYTIEGGGEW